MPSYKSRDGVPFDASQVSDLIQPYVDKFAWFKSKGYEPHLWQTIFHSLPNSDQIARFRHLVAGRRGGKTLSAAWELLFYLLHPEAYRRDTNTHHVKKPVMAWVLTKDYPAGLPALLTFREVLAQAGLTHGVEYKENRGNRWFEFANGSWLFFKTADEPNSLRGAGLDLLWIDEAAFIPNREAWDVVRPALSERIGRVISTTTPDGKNWFYDEFWSESAMEDENIGRVEYWSIDNPYFPEEEWRYAARTMHPLLFKKEYCAAFDAMAGKELSGEWLKYYASEPDLTKDIVALPRDPDTGKLQRLDLYVGVDPAISLAEDADRFAIACIGVSKDLSQVFLIDLWAGRIPFPEQLDKIQEFNNRWHPRMIGIEAVAYQAALAQQALRLPGFLPIAQMMTGGRKKAERILAMSPLFKLGRIRIRKDQNDFIDEWVDYDSSIRNPKDDCLDAVEIALRVAGGLLPGTEDPALPLWLPEERPAGSLQELADASFRKRRKPVWDDVLGDTW